jgi:hypothetical protein
MIKRNIISCTCMVFTIWITMCNVAIAGTPMNKTPWKVVDKSLGELLDSGWKIISHSSHRVVITPYTNGASDEETHTYILHKDSKYISCQIINPRPDDTYSRCRRLN